MNYFFRVILIALASLLIALLVGCSSGLSSSSTRTGKITFGIVWPSTGKGMRDIPANTQSIVIQVQTADGYTYNETQYANNPVTGTTTPTVISFGDVPVGTYEVSANAYDQTQTNSSLLTGLNGNDIAGASSSGNVVVAGQNTNVNLYLGSVININIEVPGNLHLHKGVHYLSGPVSGTVFYGDGTSFDFPDPRVTYSIPSAFASYASVSTNGVVTALKDGVGIEVDVTTLDDNNKPYTEAATFDITD